MKSNKELLASVMLDVQRDKVNLAKRVLAACTDVSCSSVGIAIGLPAWRVNLLSKGGRTGRKVTDYHAEEIGKLLGADHV